MAAEAVLASFAANTSNTNIEAAKTPNEAGASTEQTQDPDINPGENMDIDDSNATIDLIQDMDGLEVTTELTQFPNLTNNDNQSPTSSLETTTQHQINIITTTQRLTHYTPHQLALIRQIEEAAAIAARGALGIHENPRRSEQRFIEAAAVAAQIALAMHEKLVRFEDEEGVALAAKVGREEGVEELELELESVDGDGDAEGEEL